jgi:hypothetical protein
MLANVELIETHYPDTRIMIFIAPDVPGDIRSRLTASSSVILKAIPPANGCSPFFDRFRAIDEPDCNIMFVRDSDSRVHERDRGCIDDFIARPDKTLHIIRDHYHHQYPIMGGMWAIRKEHLRGVTMASLIAKWAATQDMLRYVSDQNFLTRYIYRRVDALIQDRYGRHEPVSMHTPFRVPISDNLFVGQVHLFREDGTEYTEFAA